MRVVIMNNELLKKMNSLMYAFTKEAARESFIVFLRYSDISMEEYKLIKEERAKIGITKTYL